MKTIIALCLCFTFPVLSLAQAKRITPPDFIGAKQPQVAINEEGKILVVFGKEDGIYITSSRDAGVTFSLPARIAAVEKLALGMRRGPRIATTGRATTVTAISHATGTLYSWISTDGGSSWSKPQFVNTSTNSAREGLHALAGDGQSKLISVWLDLRNRKTELWSSVSNDGGATWEKNCRVYKSPDGTICECCHPSAVFTPEGEIVVMWRNWLGGSRDMYRTFSSDGGITFSDAVKIGKGTWPLPGCPMDGGSLAAVGDEVQFAWRRERALFVTSDVNTETLLAEPGTHPVVVPNDDGFSYFWQNEGNLYWKSSASGSTERLARDAGYAVGAWSRPHGTSFVVWEGIDGIYLMKLTDR